MRASSRSGTQEDTLPGARAHAARRTHTGPVINRMLSGATRDAMENFSSPSERRNEMAENKMTRGNHPDGLTSLGKADAAAPSGAKVGELVRRLVEMGGSDLHLVADAPPAVRVNGLLRYLDDHETLRPEDTERVLG